MITREIVLGFQGEPSINTDSVYEFELVRCGQCDCFDEDGYPCKKLGIVVNDDDYCSFVEKKAK